MGVEVISHHKQFNYELPYLSIGYKTISVPLTLLSGVSSVSNPLGPYTVVNRLVVEPYSYLVVATIFRVLAATVFSCNEYLGFNLVLTPTPAFLQV